MFHLRLATSAASQMGQMQRMGMIFATSRARLATAPPSPAAPEASKKVAKVEDEVAYRPLRPMPKDFKEHPERDLVNFPHQETRLFTDKVRLVLLPDSWFQFFYKKTGVTGPYLFFGGLLVFVFQKEWWVIEHEFLHIAPFLVVLYGVSKFAGPAMQKMSHDFLEKQDKAFAKFEHDEKKQFTDGIEYEGKLQNQIQECPKYFVQAEQDNVALQLEIEYRRRQVAQFKEVKRRLDYLVDTEEAKTRLRQSHMVQWIVDQVRKGISVQQEKAMLQQCIVDLKSLAQRSG